jgi:hypothetical protein
MTGPQVSTARSPEPGVQVEARSAQRLLASSVPGIKSIRLSPHGTEATLLNISATGVLVECTSRLRLGTAVTVIFDGTFSPSSAEGRVARSSVANVSKKGVLLYHIGIAFVVPIVLEQAPAAATPQPEAASPAPSATSAQSAAPVSPVVGNRW